MKNLRHFFFISIVSGLVSCTNDKSASTATEPLKEDLQRVQNEPRHYVCYQTTDSITADGKMDEASWQKAEWTANFSDIEGSLKPAPTFQTRVKMLYDSHYLYVAAELEEPHIWAYLQNHDDIVFRDNDFEIFIDPDNDTWNYFEFEINAQQTVFDLFLPQPYRSISAALHTWDFKGLKKGVSIEGTLNNGNDTDKRWVIEVAIPFSSLAFGLDSGKPDVSKFWRIDFSRVEWDTRWVNGKYEKVTDPATGKPLPEHNWVWSPVGVVSMHMPERWGYLKFSGLKAGEGTEAFKLPENEKLRNVLWAVFYRQEAYFAKNKKFAATLPELGNDINSLFDTQKYRIELRASGTFFDCSLNDMNGNPLMTINNCGRILEAGIDK